MKKRIIFFLFLEKDLKKMIRTKLTRRISTSVQSSSQHRKDSQPGSKGGIWKERSDLPKMADYKLSLKLARKRDFKIEVSHSETINLWSKIC